MSIIKIDGGIQKTNNPIFNQNINKDYSKIIKYWIKLY